MKRAIFSTALVLSLVVAISSVGCKTKRPDKGITPIPAPKTVTVPAVGPNPPVNPNTPNVGPGSQTTPEQGPQTSKLKETGEGVGTTPLSEFEGMTTDTNQFQAETIHFDFDRSAIKPSETSKLEQVAAFLKDKADDKLLIDGHCDERGTPEYNRALGERRALSAREYLIQIGIAAERIRTRSLGSEQPADAGHDDSAWAKNRRDEFILLLPKK